MLKTGVRLGDRYEIISSLGAGGMGEVYKARDLKLGRDVAIKVLAEHLAADSAALTRFEQEAKVLASISHSNILAIHDFLTDQGTTFAVMELLQGETLRERLSTKALQWHESIRIALAVAEAISVTHASGIVHRDLKPENIFLTSEEAIKILDFGLARMERLFATADQSRLQTVSAATNPGTVLGTLHYMPPEQMRGEMVDARADIFSLGCILFEMLTGKAPFSRNTGAETIAAILTEKPPALHPRDKNAPPEIMQIVDRCLEKAPQNRFQSAQDLGFALKTLLSGSHLTQATGISQFSQPKVRKRPGKRKSGINSIAVLPFQNASGDINMEYLSDGISESIINSLSQLPKLRVIARSTVFRYKDKQIDPIQIGSDLEVAAVLTGRVVQRGDALYVQTELVDIANGSQLWGEQYKRNISDIFAVQEEISREISRTLQPKLTGAQKNRVVKRHTDSTEAYELYLKGRFHWGKRTADGLKKCIEYLNQAAEKDPEYALAYAGLSDCYNLLSAYGIQSPKECAPIARRSALRSLELDPSLAEGHEAWAHVKMLYDWDWAGAEAEFKRAIKLNPNYATAHQRFAIHLATMGRLEEASREIQKAHQLDPLSLIINADVALILFFQHRYEEAIEQCYRTLDLDPNFAVAHLTLGMVLEQKGLAQQAIAAFEKGVELSGDRSFISTQAHTYATSGKKEEAEKLLQELTQISRYKYVSPYRFAVIHQGLGHTETALELLRKTCEDRSVWLIHLHLKLDPRFEPLRSDPRFSEILRLIG